MERIPEEKFRNIVQKESCSSSIIEEYSNAISPIFVKYTISAQDFLAKKVYPLWRTNHDGTKCIIECELGKVEAFPISFADFALKPHFFQTAKFDDKRDYFETNRIISFHCNSCGVSIIKDGNHRLLQYAIESKNKNTLNRKLFIYEVISSDWSKCQPDMKNFCECT